MFQSPISSKWYSFVYIVLILILIIRMLISIITPLPTFAKNPVSTTKMHRRKKKKKQVYEKRPGNDADDIDISEVSENSKPFGITVSLYQYV